MHCFFTGFSVCSSGSILEANLNKQKNMKRDYSGGKRFGGGGGSRFGRGGFGRGGNNRNSDRTMHPAVCGDCNSDCEVPFRPDGNRPVLCRNCFKTDESSNSRSERPRSSTPSNNSSDLKAVNAKLDKILDILSNIIVEEDDGLDFED